MNSIKTKQTKVCLGAPRDWDQSQLPCDSLWVDKTTLVGVPVVISYWKPTMWELQLLNEGSSVQLSIVGTNMPPVAVEVFEAEEVE